MQKEFVRLVLFLGWGTILYCGGEPAYATAADVDAAAGLATVAGANNQFACDLYARLAKTEGNLFFSPNSLSIALAMTYAGAGGTTRAQMQQVLKFPFEGEQLNQSFKSLLDQLNEEGKKGKCKLSLANRLWGQQEYPFSATFLETTRDYYGAEMGMVDFRGNSETARVTINQWIAQKTEDKIPELLTAGTLGPKARLVLTTAIYFKGNWAAQFKKASTRKEPFYLQGENRVDVPMMNQKESFRYGETEAFQALEMPYEGKNLAMLILLPKERDGLPGVEQSLSASQLDALCKSMGTREVVVTMPKFRMEAEFNLKKTLTDMGMPDAFDPDRADFLGMTDPNAADRLDQRLCVSEVIHKAYVDVNEEGTEAAAATGVVMNVTTTSVEEPPVVFRADHPFLFLIRDVRSNSILFLGRLSKPA